MKSIDELVAEKSEKMGLDAHQREVYRKYLEKGDKENHVDYVYGLDEGEDSRGDIKN